MSEEFKKLMILVLGIFIVLACIVLRTKFLSISTINKIFYHLECNKIPYKDGKVLCLGRDGGFKSDYETAENYCAKLNLKLPSRDEARYIWLASENCQRVSASNELTENELTENDKPSCSSAPVIKFSRSLQYHNGSFWLRDAGNGKLHYAMNYYDGSMSVYKDSLNSLGVRCVGIK